VIGWAGARVPVLLFAALAQSATAGDAVAGRVKAQALCANCHGEDGVAVLPGAANLRGQQKEYLREQLRAFRSGSRHNPQMNVVAKTLSDAQIEDLAEWYSSMRITVEKPR
jgi:cytochrome c553